MSDPGNVVDPAVLAARRKRRSELAEDELRLLLRDTELAAATLEGRLSAVENELTAARAERDALVAQARGGVPGRPADSARELEELRERLAATEQALAAEHELAALRIEVQARRTEVADLEQELARRAALEAAAAQAGAAADEAERKPRDAERARREAEERAVFQDQVAAVERAVAALQAELAAPDLTTGRRIAAERDGRERAEWALAGVRAELALRTQREAAVNALVADLGVTADRLREQLASQLRSLREEVRVRLASERAAFEERTQELTRVAEELRGELAREQNGRWLVETELVQERERVASLTAELDRLRSAPAIEAVIGDIGRAARRLHAQADADARAEEQARADTEPPAPRVEPGTDAHERPEELVPARPLPAPISSPRHLAVPVVVPSGGDQGAWLRESIGWVGKADPVLAAELLLALVPVQAHVARRDVVYELTIGGAGTWLVTLQDGSGRAQRHAPGGEAEFRVSGSPGEVASLLAGGGPRRLEARVEGRRRARALARSRRSVPTLAQAIAAGGSFGLRGVLALAANAAAPGAAGSLAFDAREHSVTVGATDDGPVLLRIGLHPADATLRAPVADLVALLVGLAPEGPIVVEGDEPAALSMLARLHRAQGLS